MTYKSILVHAEAAAAHSVRLRCAADLANSFGATVIGLGAEAIAPLGVSAGGGYDTSEAVWVAAKRELIKENLIVAEARFREALCTRPHEWRASWSMPTETMAQMARGADLIVVGGADRRINFDPYSMVDIGHLILTAGRPVLLCPSQSDRVSPRSALVAWKDTRESRRALADAIPFLQRAQEVVVLEVRGEEDMGCSAARVADVIFALQRHGITARPRTVVKQGSTAEAIVEQADHVGAALIVAGGYGHSRFGEWVFGGVTRTLLDQDRRFVLFSH